MENTDIKAELLGYCVKQLTESCVNFVQKNMPGITGYIDTDGYPVTVLPNRQSEKIFVDILPFQQLLKPIGLTDEQIVLMFFFQGLQGIDNKGVIQA